MDNLEGSKSKPERKFLFKLLLTRISPTHLLQKMYLMVQACSPLDEQEYTMFPQVMLTTSLNYLSEVLSR